jgi:multiple sugar transport system permease protein
MLGLIYTVKTFDIVVALTDGGPANATQLMSTWAYTESFVNFNFGAGAAVGNLLLVWCMLIALFYIRASSREMRG